MSFNSHTTAKCLLTVTQKMWIPNTHNVKTDIAMKEQGSRRLLIHIPVNSVHGHSITGLCLGYGGWTMHKMPCERRHADCSRIYFKKINKLRKLNLLVGLRNGNQHKEWQGRTATRRKIDPSLGCSLTWNIQSWASQVRNLHNLENKTQLSSHNKSD